MTNYAGSHMLCCSNVSEWLIIPHKGAEYNEKRNIMMKMNNDDDDHHHHYDND